MKIFLKPLIFSAAIIFCADARAQESFFSAGFGYGFSTGDLLSSSQTNTGMQNVYGSYARGLTLGMNIGYMVNENIGFDLGAWYVMGSAYAINTFDANLNNVTQELRGSTIRVMPAVKLVTGKQSKPYAKFGLLLGIDTGVEWDGTYANTNPIVPTSYMLLHKFKGGSSFGWMGAFGIDFSENQTASVFLELNICHQVFSPDREVVSNPSGATQTYVLVDDLNTNATYEKLKPSFPFSSIGINAGVKFSLGGKKTDASPAPAVK